MDLNVKSITIQVKWGASFRLGLSSGTSLYRIFGAPRAIEGYLPPRDDLKSPIIS